MTDKQKKDLLKLTKRQQNYVVKLQKAFQKCIDNNIRFYHVMDIMTAYNSKHVKCIKYTNYYENNNVAQYLIEDSEFYASISHGDLDGWADDGQDHEIIFK